MDFRDYDRVVGLVYDAALDGSRWEHAVVALANAMRCIQGTLEIHDPYAGISRRLAPLCDPAFGRSHAEYYGKLFSLAGRTERFAVGEVFDSNDIGLNSDTFRASEFYNEWWLPQGTGGATLMANVARDGRATASVTLYRAHGETSFDERQRNAFGTLVGHLGRAVEIHRRLLLAENALAAHTPARCNIAVIDSDHRILHADQATRSRLSASGLLRSNGLHDCISSPDARLEQLISEVVGPSRRGSHRAGEVRLASADGNDVVVTVSPCTEAMSDKWFSIDRPVAVLSIVDQSDRTGAKLDRLIRTYGLSRAEAAVAVEIAKGDGRAAAAHRLGIRPATVRSHLSSIFDKMDVHRQAQLTRLVGRA